MTETALSAFKKTKFFGGLDGLRFFSIAAVVWHHSGREVVGPRILGLGFLGVDLFFVISGFLIVTLLLREKDKAGSISLKGFYIRRSLRIFPLYYGFVLGLAAVYFLFRPDSAYGSRLISELPVYLFHMSNLVPVALGMTWSLASEEQFYLVWPCLEKYFRKHIFAILAVLIAINQVINFWSHELFGYFNMGHLAELNVMQATFTPILLGVLLAHLMHKEIGFKQLGALIASKYSAVIWVVAILIAGSFAPADISGFPRLLIQCLLVMLVGSVVVSETNPLMGVLKLRPLARIGAISYGIYLFHIHAIILSRLMLDAVGARHPITVFALGLGLSVVFAELSFRFFETPFLKMKSKFSAFHPPAKETRDDRPASAKTAESLPAPVQEADEESIPAIAE